METKSEDGNDAKIQINPRVGKIQANTVGFFIAQSADEVKRLEWNFLLMRESDFFNKRNLNTFLSERGSIAKHATTIARMKRL